MNFAQKNKNVSFMIIATSTIVLLSGCSTKKVKTRLYSSSNGAIYERQSRNTTNQFRYQPVIGTMQDDTKVMIDMGKFAKIWVKNYRNKNKTFVSSHHIVTMIREPGYIYGEELPENRIKTIHKTYSGHTFVFRSNDLFSSSDPTNNMKTQEIKQFINNYHQSKRIGLLKKKKRVNVDKYDKTILDYIKAKQSDVEQYKKQIKEKDKELKKAKQNNVDIEKIKQKEQEIEELKMKLKQKEQEIQRQNRIIEEKENAIEEYLENDLK